MIDNEILDWVKQEFQPVFLATPDETIRQIIQNAKRYWNTHSAYPVVQMYQVPANGVIQLTTVYKGVYDCYPATQPDWILANYPVWSLLGITVIDNLTSDLIELSEAYRNFRYYMGTDFKWRFQKSDNPAIGPMLYTSNVPVGTSAFAVLGTARIVDNTPVTSEHILNWLLYYCKALVKIAEGNTLRKVEAVGVKNDGTALITEGKEEVKALQDSLAQEGRWVAFSRRF